MIRMENEVDAIIKEERNFHYLYFTHIKNTQARDDE